MRGITLLFTAHYAGNNDYIYRIYTNKVVMYIHQLKNWPHFQWNEEAFISLLSEVSNLQGKLMGKVAMLGFDLKEEANLETLIQDVLQTSAIEGELLNPELVRSSIATRLGLEHSGVSATDRNVDAIVSVLFDATQNNNKQLTDERLFGWHDALFPTGRSGLYKIEVGQWRTGAMQVVSGAMGREIVHYEAPNGSNLDSEMAQFISWFTTEDKIESLLKAAISHLWFITIHPFDDGNGRIARAITDLQLSKSDGVNKRFYSMSNEINKQKNSYYKILEQTQKGNLDVSQWIIWFLECLKNSILSSSLIIDKVVNKHQFWNKNAQLICNERQVKMLNKLMDGFEGNLNTSKWAKINKTSTDTALRDITDLVHKNVLQKATSAGRSTHYVLKDFL